MRRSRQVAVASLGAAALSLGAAAPAPAYLRDFQVTYSSRFNSATVKEVSATCFTGKQAIGAGGWVRPPHDNLGLDTLWVHQGLRTAYAGAVKTGPGFAGSYINVHAYCVTNVGVVPLGGGAPFLKQRQITSNRR